MKNIINHQPIVGVMRWGVWGNHFTTEQYEEIIYQCLSIGLNEFDHADIYGHYTTEAEFGKALQNNSSLRTQIKIITKCGIQMITPNRPAGLFGVIICIPHLVIILICVLKLLLFCNALPNSASVV